MQLLSENDVTDGDGETLFLCPGRGWRIFALDIPGGKRLGYRGRPAAWIPFSRSRIPLARSDIRHLLSDDHRLIRGCLSYFAGRETRVAGRRGRSLHNVVDFHRGETNYRSVFDQSGVRFYVRGGWFDRGSAGVGVLFRAVILPGRRIHESLRAKVRISPRRPRLR